jgi:hypothetical protein
MNYVERLNEALKLQLKHPWSSDRSGGERVWFLVFDPEQLRKVLARKDLFKLSVEAAGKRWIDLDIAAEFGTWMRDHRYAERYFQRPQLARSIADDFSKCLAERITTRIAESGADEASLLVLTGAESLYGITRLSHITSLIEDSIPGRLMVFFPGSYSDTQYRLLNARDGWNYLAVPIVPVSGKGSD